MATKEELQKQIEQMQEQMKALLAVQGTQPQGARVGVTLKNSNYLWFRHPSIQTASKKGKDYVPTVSMPKEALLSLLNDEGIREDLIKALKSLEA